MSERLESFDYTRPLYYMVTLHRLDGLAAFSSINEHGVVNNAITRAFHKVIRSFHSKWPEIEQICFYVIMPDHIHLLIQMSAVAREKRLTLGTIVFRLNLALSEAYAKAQLAVQGAPSAAQLKKVDPIFAKNWHDWIVMRKGQLNAFITYIRENPKRSWLRKNNHAYFQRVKEITFLGRKWYGYGNAALLKLPVIEPFHCSRQWPKGGKEWKAALARASRIGPGGAGISTFMSPCEKACGNAIGSAGGRWIVLWPEGFPELWHPSSRLERFCAEGRMLFLSLWPARTRQLTRAELYARCHEMGEIVETSLAH